MELPRDQLANFERAGTATEALEVALLSPVPFLSRFEDLKHLSGRIFLFKQDSIYDLSTDEEHCPKPRSSQE